MSRDLSIDVIRRLTEAGHVAYWAGGCVRDLLRGFEPSDYDVATDAVPEQIRKIFGRGRTLTVGESFGVMIVLGPKGSGEQVEVATFRREGEYSDGRRPDRIEFCTAEQDAQRRDFTINGMFYDPLTETVHDFVGGQQDLQAGIVRAIGDPHRRMDEDKLRLMRAVRFTAALNFQLDPATAEAVRQMASQIIIVSAERIAQELRRMLAHPNRKRAVELCEGLGLLQVILPEVHDFTIQHSEERWQTVLAALDLLGEGGSCRAANSEPAPVVLVRFESALALLLRDVPITSEESQKADENQGSVTAVCRRLKLSNHERDRIVWHSQHRDAFCDVASQPLAAIKRLAAHPDFSALVEIEQAWARASGVPLAPFEWLNDFLQRTPQEEINPPELLTGRDLIAMGYKPGPQFKRWLDAVRDAQLNGEISTRTDAIEFFKRLQ